MDILHRSKKVVGGIKKLLSNKPFVQIRKNSSYYNYRYGTQKYINIYKSIQI